MNTNDDECIQGCASYDRMRRQDVIYPELSHSINIRPQDILEAIQYRSLDRKLFS